ncbi:MAG: ABC transporter permease [Theionarchaea archaeon]|nr:MAG: peptide ABC transporter permease [Theionarchaea archaeon DG-70-1]MBU7026698.1 ABC transporter permease [Theionarchaea archaeon]
MELRDYILRRLFLLIPVLLGVLVLVFTISYVIPTDPARQWAGGLHAREEQVELLRERYHLNDPLYMQIYYYLDGLIHGDLGISASTRRPVLDDLKAFFPATFELAIFSFILSMVGIPFGVISALKRNKLIDHISRVVSLTGASTPLFWMALLLQFIFYYKLGWLPAAGRLEVPLERITGMVLIDSVITGNAAAFKDALARLAMPSFCMAFWSMGYLVRITRSSMLEVLNAEYIMTAKAKGIPQRIVHYRHALKNAIIPPITLLGIRFGWLLAGSVLLETIFAWPGMGRYAASSIVEVDLPAMVGFCLVVALVMIMANLIVDITYAFIDPRVRVGGTYE